MGGWSRRAWACPFFAGDERTQIRCEWCRLAFPSPAEKAAFADAFCGSAEGYHACTIARMLEKFYEKSTGGTHGQDT